MSGYEHVGEITADGWECTLCEATGDSDIKALHDHLEAKHPARHAGGSESVKPPSDHVQTPKHDHTDTRETHTLGLARQHLTAALNHSLDGRDTATHRHLDAAIHALFDELGDERWRELAAAKVEHVRGDRRAARAVVRETAQLVDARLEVGDDA
jgi:hypothetical protein